MTSTVRLGFPQCESSEIRCISPRKDSQTLKNLAYGGGWPKSIFTRLGLGVTRRRPPWPDDEYGHSCRLNGK